MKIIEYCLLKSYKHKNNVCELVRDYFHEGPNELWLINRTEPDKMFNHIYRGRYKVTFNDDLTLLTTNEEDAEREYKRLCDKIRNIDV